MNMTRHLKDNKSEKNVSRKLLTSMRIVNGIVIVLREIKRAGGPHVFLVQHIPDALIGEAFKITTETC